MHVGGFNHPITIERKVQIGTKSLGEPNTVWQTFVEPFAEVSILRGREHFDPGTKQRYSEDVWHFRVHYYDIVGVSADMRVVDENDQVFDIKSMRPDEHNRQDCIIECTAQDGVVGAAALLGYVDDAIADGATGVVYDGFTVKASGGTAPYTYAVTGGALPTGLTLNASSGAVAGTPSAAGTFSPIITVTDAAATTHVLPALSIVITV